MQLILCQLQLQIVLVQKKSVNAMGTALNVYVIIKKETKIPIVPVASVNRKTDSDNRKSGTVCACLFLKKKGRR